MCFSAEADFTAAAVIAVPAADALRHVTHRREIPIAAIPALFVAHSLMSGVAWLWFGGSVPAGLGEPAGWLYVVVAFPLLPALVPWAIFAIEQPGPRRQVIGVIATVGTAAGSVLLWRLVIHGYVAVPHDDWVQWGPGGVGSDLVTAGYLIGTCGAMLISGDRWIVAYGIGNIAAAAAIVGATTEGFASLWCLWAALTSGFIAVLMRRRQRLQDQEPVLA